MSFYGQILALISLLFIKGLFVSILIIMLAQVVFKQINIKKALNIAGWLLIIYSILTIIQLLILSLLSESSQALFERATGSYSWAFGLMVSGPFVTMLLFIKKFRDNIYILLLMAAWINFGWLMESLVIHITAMHRDYINNSPTTGEFAVILRGVLIGIILLIIGNVSLWIKKLRLRSSGKQSY